MTDVDPETVVYATTPDIVPGETIETHPGDPATPPVVPGVDLDEVDAAVAAVAGMSPTGGTRRAIEHLARALTPTTEDP